MIAKKNPNEGRDPIKAGDVIEIRRHRTVYRITITPAHVKAGHVEYGAGCTWPIGPAALMAWPKVVSK